MIPILERLNERRDFVEDKLSNHIKSESGCWEFQGQKNRQGYGKFEVASKVKYPRKQKVYAHRAAYALHYQFDPVDWFVCHSCDNPQCINPSHLWLGTTADNMQDMAKKGRAAKQDGFNNHACKVTEADIKEIKRLIASGLNNKKIAERMPISHSMVSRIRLGKSWADVA